jgi:hypothetical protein
VAAIAPDRRAFLTSSAATLAAAAGGSEPLNLPPGKPVKRRTRRANRIAVSTYSFWQFRRKDLRNIETCIDLAADMGFDGVEILHRQMEQEDNAYLQRVKRRAFLLGLDLCGFSTHQTFLSPDRQTRQKNIDHTWITTRLSKKASRAWTA